MRLIVLRGSQAKLDVPTARKSFDRQEVALVDISAISGERVKLVRCVEPREQAIATSAVAITPNDHDLVLPASPLALDSEKLRPEIEDEVVAFDRVRAPDTDTELRCASRDLEFGDGSLLIRREHVVEHSNGLGSAMSASDILRPTHRVR